MGPDSPSEEKLPTIESITDSLKNKRAASASPSMTATPEHAPYKPTSGGPPLGSETPISGDPAGLEAEADQQGAFNPETGEINWDCPCLGGMATGPCGEEFKAAFSCFVYSENEPKGMECVDKFK
jgi:intermembrane space import and assembly protein 40